MQGPWFITYKTPLQRTPGRWLTYIKFYQTTWVCYRHQTKRSRPREFFLSDPPTNNFWGAHFKQSLSIGIRWYYEASIQRLLEAVEHKTLSFFWVCDWTGNKSPCFFSWHWSSSKRLLCGLCLLFLYFYSLPFWLSVCVCVCLCDCKCYLFQEFCAKNVTFFGFDGMSTHQVGGAANSTFVISAPKLF